MKIYKKMNLLLVFFLSITSFLSAEVRERFYVGVGGVDSINHFQLQVKNPLTQLQVKRKHWHNELLGNAFLGYGSTFRSGLYLAGEIGTYFPRRSVQFSRPGVSLVLSNFRNRLSMQDYLTADLLLGYRVQEDFLIYLRGGISWAHLEIYQWPNLSLEAPSFFEEKNRAAGRIGAGINYGITKHFGFGVDYIFTAYQKERAVFVFQQVPLQFEEKNFAHFIGLSLFYSF